MKSALKRLFYTALMVGICFYGVSAADKENDKEQTVILKPVKMDFIPLSAAQETPQLKVTDKITLGKLVFPVEQLKDGEQLKIATEPEGKPKQLVKSSDSVIELKLPKEAGERYWIVLKHTDKGWFYLRAGGLSAKINETLLVFIDQNTNGLFGESGMDGIIYPGSRYVIPLEQEMVVGRCIVKLKIQEEGKSVAYTSRLMVEKETYMQGLEMINQFRVCAGLHALPIDSGICRYCELHAKYLNLNPEQTNLHGEDSAKPEYTKEGARAGFNSCIGKGQNMESAIRCFFDSLWHRVPFTRPWTKAYGFGDQGKFSLVDYETNADHNLRPWLVPILFPAPEQMDVGTNRFMAEGPKPETSANGICVTLDFLNDSSVKLIEARMICQGQKLDMPKPEQRPLPPGEDVKMDCFWPGKSASPSFQNNLSTIALIPEKPLKQNSYYWVWAKYQHLGKETEKTWWFKTTGNVSYDGK
jgi:hypothetical protein